MGLLTAFSAPFQRAPNGHGVVPACRRSPLLSLVTSPDLSGLCDRQQEVVIRTRPSLYGSNPVDDLHEPSEPIDQTPRVDAARPSAPSLRRTWAGHSLFICVGLRLQLRVDIRSLFAPEKTCERLAWTC